MPKEVDPKDTKRAAAYELWMKAPNPMVTFFKTFDVTNLIRISRKRKPVEPIHVHIAKGKPSENATKVWITSAGNCLLCNNNSRIPSHTLRNIMRMIEARSTDIIQKWFTYFGEISYYC